jgi:hypothetical protein
MCLHVGSFIASAQVPEDLQSCMWLGEHLFCDPAGALNIHVIVDHKVHCDTCVRFKGPIHL